MGVTKAEGIVPMEERRIAADTARYKLVRKNWFAYNPMRLNIGSIARWRGEYDILVSPDYVVFRCIDDETPSIAPDYLDHFRQSDQWEQFVTESGIGSVRVRIYFKDIGRLSLPLPSPAEQRKIADCLGSLDDLIAAEGRKLEALRDHKKGLMQQFFPREGETRPRLRFPEFQDAPEWEEQRLEQIAGFQSGGTPSKGNPNYWNGTIPWVSAKDMKQLVLDDTEDNITEDAVEDGAKLVPAGTVLMLTRGMTLLKDVPICLLSRPMAFNQDIRALRPKNAFDGRFLAYMLVCNKQRIRNMVDIAGHGTGRLNTDRMKALELLFPSPVEQQRIADCFAFLDAIIAAQAEKLDALRTHKRGLMQQLFPSPEDAEA